MITSLQMFIPEFSPWKTLVMSIKTCIYTKFSCGAFGFELLLLFSHCKLCHSATPRTAAYQASLSITISQSLPKFTSIELVMPYNHLILNHLFSFCLPSFKASGSFPMNQLFTSGGQIIGASALASIIPMNIQGWFPLGLTGLISLRDSQESSPTPEFEGINSLVLCLPYDPTLTSVHDCWKGHGLGYMDLCWHSDFFFFFFAFWYAV